mmetsp:Transcript_11414/g.37486  ORF Transcript_11414/g.37486 Transcript_11414/m.37486 type:complete len:292 (+) Transcript_11414:941-1816(+)
MTATTPTTEHRRRQLRRRHVRSRRRSGSPPTRRLGRSARPASGARFFGSSATRSRTSRKLPSHRLHRRSRRRVRRSWPRRSGCLARARSSRSLHQSRSSSQSPPGPVRRRISDSRDSRSCRQWFGTDSALSHRAPSPKLARNPHGHRPRQHSQQLWSRSNPRRQTQRCARRLRSRSEQRPWQEEVVEIKDMISNRATRRSRRRRWLEKSSQPCARRCSRCARACWMQRRQKLQMWRRPWLQSASGKSSPRKWPPCEPSSPSTTAEGARHRHHPRCCHDHQRHQQRRHPPPP